MLGRARCEFSDFFSVSLERVPHLSKENNRKSHKLTCYSIRPLTPIEALVFHVPIIRKWPRSFLWDLQRRNLNFYVDF